MAENELPEIQSKQINGVSLSNLEIAKISMICDYLVLDRFHDISSFIRFEQCFGPLFSKENQNFLIEAFQEICGPKRKYISFGRLIFAYTKWKSNSSTNENFNKFMKIVFENMILTNNDVIGELGEGGQIFNTRNTKGRKIISKFSVFTDEEKNIIRGFKIQYDDVFDVLLSKKKSKEKKSVNLEINFPPNETNFLDRDGISHIAGKFSVTDNIIKFLIFKCRSGKTFYIGDNSENDQEEIKLFLFGTSNCQLRALKARFLNEKLVYLEPNFQSSIRVNQKIIPFDLIDEKYINENIINSQLIFEENEIQNIPIEELNLNSLLIPCIDDDAFIEKDELTEKISGKNFNEVYNSFLTKDNKEDQEKEDLKKQIYEKTLERKNILKKYFSEFKNKENILASKTSEQPKERIIMDKFLVKIEKVENELEIKKEEIKEEENKKEDKKEEIINEIKEEKDMNENKKDNDNDNKIIEIKKEEENENNKIKEENNKIIIEEKKEPKEIIINNEEKNEKEIIIKKDSKDLEDKPLNTNEENKKNKDKKIIKEDKKEKEDNIDDYDNYLIKDKNNNTKEENKNDTNENEKEKGVCAPCIII